MALQHQSYLADIQGFQIKISPIIDALDSNNATPLFDAALEIVFKKRSDNWILKSAGSGLFDIRSLDFTGRPYQEPIMPRLKNVRKINSSTLGYWLLIIFSTYLRFCDGIGSDYEILEFCLNSLSMRTSDIRLLIDGLPTSLLIKAHASEEPKILRHTDPYWYWMRPSHSFGHGGWLPKDIINNLFDELTSRKNSIETFNPKLFGKQWGTLTISALDGQIDYYNRAQATYKSALSMLQEAKLSNCELYVVKTYT
jgi:hypothetical protein